MRRAARGIVIKDNQLLVMHRNNFGAVYATLPGGSVEVGETPEQALYREFAEETMVTIGNPRLVFVEHAGNMYGDQYIFLCDYVAGEPQLHPESEEMHINKLGKNLHEPAWLPLDELPKTLFLSDELQKRILACVQNGWPQMTEEFTSTRNV